jgi:hypothetical protein
MSPKKRNKMERKNHQRSEITTQDNRKTEQQPYPEYIWVSYTDEVNKKTEEESDNSILERSNRFAL